MGKLAFFCTELHMPSPRYIAKPDLIRLDGAVAEKVLCGIVPLVDAAGRIVQVLSG